MSREDYVLPDGVLSLDAEQKTGSEVLDVLHTKIMGFGQSFFKIT